MNKAYFESRWGRWLTSFGLLVSSGAIALSPGATAELPQSLAAENSVAENTTLPAHWRPASPNDQALIWRFVLQSPLGVAALNQLAIEGFISPLCEKTLYTHADYDTFQTLMQVQCPTARGISTARSYDEVRLTLNRFEDTITDFSVERIYTD